MWRRARLRTPAGARFVAAGAVDAVLTIVAVEAWRRATGRGSLLDHDHDDEHAHDHGGHPGPPPLSAERLRTDAGSAAVAGAVDVLLDGRTPGRALLGMRLVRRDGAPVDPRTALVREAAPRVFARALQALVVRVVPAERAPMAAIGVALGLTYTALQAADDEHRTLGDRIAGTRVVRG